MVEQSRAEQSVSLLTPNELDSAKQDKTFSIRQSSGRKFNDYISNRTLNTGTRTASKSF